MLIWENQAFANLSFYDQSWLAYRTNMMDRKIIQNEVRYAIVL